MNGFFDHIKRTRQADGKAYWLLDDVLSDLGVQKVMFREQYPSKAHKFMRENGLDTRKLFEDFGDWVMTEIGLIGVVGSLIPFHGNIDRITQAKVALGLMMPPTPPIPSAPRPTLAVIHNPAPVVVNTPSPTLSIFTYGQNEVRTVMKDGEPWWVAKDVCDILGLKNSRDAMNGLDDDERGVANIYTPSGEQSMNVINESGLYSLILRSRKPEAKQFKRWITHEVIPTIRKTGSYGVAPATAAPALPQDYKSALVALLAEVEKTEKLGAQVKELAPKAEFANAIQGSVGAVTVGEFIKAATIIGFDGKPLGVQKAFTIMRELKIVHKKSGTHFPNQNHINAGRLEVRESTRLNGNGDEVPCFTTVVTGKGQIWLRDLISSYIDEQMGRAA